MKIVVLENLKSAYNVWNIVRLADNLWYDVMISWFTPSPLKNTKTQKTSLNADKNVKIYEIWDNYKANIFIKKNYKVLICSEIYKNSISISDFVKMSINLDSFWILFWNENNWVNQETIEMSDYIIHIPMSWTKESLNVCNSAAILMWELSKNIK